LACRLTSWLENVEKLKISPRERNGGTKRS
jgi:hypothetical protein